MFSKFLLQNIVSQLGGGWEDRKEKKVKLQFYKYAIFLINGAILKRPGQTFALQCVLKSHQ
jgi:hypothetical protein